MKDIHVTPTVTVGAYAALDAVGGKLEFEDACTPYANHGRIRQAHLMDKAKQDDLLHLVLFSEDFTATADNSPFAVSDADLAHVVAVISFEAANYATFNANSFCAMGLLGIDINLPFVLKEGETSLFGQLYTGTGATPTYASTTDLTIGLLIG